MSEKLKPNIESLPFIKQEKELLKQETEFLKGREKGAYVGLLTNSSVDMVSTFYPGITEGILGIYKFVEKEATDPLSPHGFLNRYIKAAHSLGKLLTNEEIVGLRKRMDAGEFNEQFEAYRLLRAVSPLARSSDDGREGRFEKYRPIHDENDIVFNKRICLARVQGLKSDLQSVYGEVDCQKALLTELILSAPFLTTVISGKPVDDEAQKRYQSYLEEAVEFVRSFDLDKRVQKFEEATIEYPVKWTYEPSVYGIPTFDKQYVERVYKLAGLLKDGQGSIEEIYSVLSDTILRRDKIFKIFTVETPTRQTEIRILPERLQPVFFDDIAGYEDQKRFLQILLARTQIQDPIVDDIRIIISAGKQGLGKTLGVKAFLNALPQNAKGAVVSIDAARGTRGNVPEYDFLMKLASYHPELHIFAVIEDIDTLTGDRLQFASTRKFLEIDSVTSDSNPKNFHLIATTNRPDVIDPAVTRPGRTAKILVYQKPKPQERKEIIAIYGNKNNYHFS
ncbi:MAG: ATP-binding protein, partial [Patescibacteria group bacterium]|nr:ATP-binding protein [Patescibacteria group bacterium]